MRLITFYLPQFHNVDFNNRHHGEGFTEWTSLRNSTALYEGHNAPRVPLNNNYYDLENDEVKQWQIELAKRGGIHGFCMYHYWSAGELLLERPVEQWLNNKSLDFPFCLSWANHPWSQHLTGGSRKLIRDQRYGDEEEWQAHFDYLLPYFKDSRYIRDDSKPIFVIYRPNDIPRLNDRLDYYQKLARESGLDGITFIFQDPYFANKPNEDLSRFTYGIEFQPAFAIQNMRNPIDLFIRKIGGKIVNKLIGILGRQVNVGIKKLEVLSYDDIWKTILKHKPVSDMMLPGAFTDWDNTPRTKEFGLSLSGVTVEKYQDYLTQLIVKAKREYKKDMIFITAWNEWAEGCYFEPDTAHEYGFLDATKKALVAAEKEFSGEKVK